MDYDLDIADGMILGGRWFRRVKGLAEGICTIQEQRKRRRAKYSSRFTKQVVYYELIVRSLILPDPNLVSTLILPSPDAYQFNRTWREHSKPDYPPEPSQTVFTLTSMPTSSLSKTTQSPHLTLPSISTAEVLPGHSYVQPLDRIRHQHASS